AASRTSRAASARGRGSPPRASARSSTIASFASPANASSTPTAAWAWMASRRRSMAESGNPTPQAAGEANYLRFREDIPADEPAVSLDAFFEQPNAVSVRIEAGDDPERLIPHLARVRLVEV